MPEKAQGVRAGERGELPSGEPEVASPVEQRSTATA
jgi:hypothetical protein